MADLFISYNRGDKHLADKLGEALKRRGFEVWWDVDLVTGEVFRDVVDRELAECKAVLVIWSPQSVKSHWVIGEAEYGKKHNKLLPVTFEHTIEPPLGFSVMQVQNLFGWTGSPQDKRIDQIIVGVARLIEGKPLGEELRSLVDAIQRKPGASGASSPRRQSGVSARRLLIGSAAIGVVFAVLAQLAALAANLDLNLARLAVDAAVYALAVMAIRFAFQIIAQVQKQPQLFFLDRSFAFWLTSSSLAAVTGLALGDPEVQENAANLLKNFPVAVTALLFLIVFVRGIALAAQRLLRSL